MIHIIMHFTPNKFMLSNAELFRLSLNKNGNVKYDLTVILQPYQAEKIEIEDDINDKLLHLEDFLEEDFVDKNFLIKSYPELFKDAEIYYCSIPYTYKPPIRYHIKPKSEVVLFLDFDLVICNSLHPLLTEIKGCNFAGCLATLSPFFPNEKFFKYKGDLLHANYTIYKWREIFEFLEVELCDLNYTTIGDDMPSPLYFNSGMIFVSSNILYNLKNELSLNIHKMNKKYKNQSDKNFTTYLHQICLCVSLEKIKANRKILDYKYNYLSSTIDNIIDLKDIIIFHNLIYRKIVHKKFLYNKTCYELPSSKIFQYVFEDFYSSYLSHKVML